MEQQYKEARIEFLKSSLRKDDNQKIDDLKKIIELGKKLNKDVRPDEKKLAVLNKSIKVINNKNIESAQTSSNNKQNKEKQSNLLYSIKNVTTSNNSIVVDFNVDIKEDDIKFFELKPSPLYRDVFDIKGYFKDALATKLAIQGVEQITIGQFQPDVLRIVISGNNNPDTSYKITKRQLIIDVNSKQSTKKDEIKEISKQKIEPNSNIQEMVDLKNSIRSISSSGDKITIQFNKKISQKDLKYSTLKQNGNFEYIFDINGKYSYIEPTKLNLNSIDKVITTENKNSVRIRLINKNNPKIKYILKSNELTIEVLETQSEKVEIAKNSSDSNSKTNLPTKVINQVQNTTPKNAINKTIVIDAGHGGDDVGAVGPNKEYEKVINLEVAKYLDNILKQRGYKVYLTRTTDKFIKVMDRTILANEKNADLFISIHTNSMPKEKASSTSGIETFFLSPARSERAKKVAALENKDDIREMSESSKNVFLESLNRPRITASHKFAIDVQSGLLQAARTKYKDVRDTGVKEGPFWVLVGAQMPSILIELGFISHPVESKRLYDKDYQQVLANGIANGIDSYFLKNP
ncbi:N-acetylmuramoyl-L-alanine amidase [Arcobacter cryaerophilus gv. pseudocryaerophilus]|uniref:N-acetylmuramoyl-L-alanine amidase n=3 Tax=unclassified Arcobacter TaxID=2593671 RepID=A0AA96L1X1_9BACT|nr:N-acetylmuramoyl-L-alanine amidase [Arcobacter sp. AZ-2023]WPD05471.1 N-acetylmuramoyl-L-alanine amidase [Arcobacter sp. DSM 115956]WPD07563.1 N-acetylmuramoyl-L-alanine amidase [Arcobacter sp. DSM 115955]WNL31829.1 N-acetylmuramoyl-L-alanine amidase [Arcobacter sp. AZ-2023]WNP37979.1 N-acetylmuramoyl-L-alanine amidase [Arcobacter sp. AZ-2023]